MRSGLEYTEGTYNLKDDGVRLGFRPNLEKHILKIRLAEPPGRFKYQSINTMLLGLAVQRTTGKKLYAYLEEKLWRPLGAAHDASWNMDSRRHRMVIASSAINATARDFALLGRLYLRGGVWRGRRILDSAWVATIASPDTARAYGGYKSQWWSMMAARTFGDRDAAADFLRRTPGADSLHGGPAGYTVRYRTGAYNARGFFNQIIYVNPAKNLVVVRLGRGWDGGEEFYRFIYGLGERL